MSLPDLLKLGLNLADGLVLELLDFFQSAADHTEGLRIDPRRRQDLVGLRVLGLQRLLNRLQLLLEDQVAQTSLAMHIVNDVVELLEQLLLLLLDVLVLLQANFVLPLDLLILLLRLHDLLLFFG